MSKFERRLLREYATEAGMRVARRAAASLKRSRHTLSGDDSGLRNTWAEICVQVQDTEGPFWDAYVAAMRDAVVAAMTRLGRRDLVALWLETEGGCEWNWDIADQEDDARDAGESLPMPELAHVPVDDEAIADFIVKEYLQPLAATESSSDVRNYLDQRYEYDGLETAGQWVDEGSTPSVSCAPTQSPSGQADSVLPELCEQAELFPADPPSAESVDQDRLDNDLISAARLGDCEGCRRALAAGANIRAETLLWEVEPLFLAVRSVSIETVKLLLRMGGNPHVADGGSTPLDRAVDAGHAEIAEILRSAMNEGDSRTA